MVAFYKEGLTFYSTAAAKVFFFEASNRHWMQGAVSKASAAHTQPTGNRQPGCTLDCVCNVYLNTLDCFVRHRAAIVTCALPVFLRSSLGLLWRGKKERGVDHGSTIQLCIAYRDQHARGGRAGSSGCYQGRDQDEHARESSLQGIGYFYA